MYIIDKNERLTQDGAIIPQEVGNADYERFLLWKLDGNSPSIETYSPEELLQQAKDKKVSELIAYDLTKNVFILGGEKLWLSRGDRQVMLLRVQAESHLGAVKTNALGFELSIDQAILILNSVEVYSSKVWDSTNRVHIPSIRVLNSVDEVEGYDFTKGYPEVLELAND